MESEMSTRVTCTDCGMNYLSSGQTAVPAPMPPMRVAQKVDQPQHRRACWARNSRQSEGKVKDINLPLKKNPRLDFLLATISASRTANGCREGRVIDRDKDQYKETVIDPQTGQVIHQNKEPLSEHFGHGSASSRMTKPNPIIQPRTGAIKPRQPVNSILCLNIIMDRYKILRRAILLCCHFAKESCLLSSWLGR